MTILQGVEVPRSVLLAFLGKIEKAESQTEDGYG